MKVVYFPYRPGGNPYQSLFASALEKAGLQVERVSPSKWLPLQRVGRVEGDILQLDWPHDWYRGRSRLSEIAKRIMYVNGLKRLSKKPLVWTVHNLVAHDARDLQYEMRMIQKLINVSNGLIVFSELAKTQLYDTYRIPHDTKVSVVYHGHYMDVYENEVGRDEARQQLGLSASTRVALFIGRLLPYKGIEELVQAFSETGLDDTALVIAGSCSDEYRQSLQALVNNKIKKGHNIRFVPEFIPDNQLQVYFSAADVVALPFKNILNSGSLLMAMSFGKCAVAPAIGSIEEVACKRGWFAYQAESELGFALKQALLCDDIQIREQEVLRYTSERFGWDRVADSVSKLYSDILG